MRTVGSLLKKQLSEERNSDCIFEPPSVIKQYNNTIHHSTKMTPNQTSKKPNEKMVYTNLQDRRVRQKPKFKLGQPVPTADIKRVFSKRDSTNYSYKIYTKQKSYMTLPLAIESTVYPRDIMKIYYYQQNQPLNKTILL